MNATEITLPNLSLVQNVHSLSPANFKLAEDAIQWRYAVKKFDAQKKIPNRDWQTLETALVKSPSAYGLQPWQFLVIDDLEIRRKLTAASWNQTQVEDASHFVVFTAKTSLDASYIDEFIAKMAETRQVSTESLAPYRAMIFGSLMEGKSEGFAADWSARQTYLALGFTLSIAAILNIDACPMEGIIPEAYDDILGLRGSGYRTLLACAFGYRDGSDKYAQVPKVRFNPDRVLKYI